MTVPARNAVSRLPPDIADAQPRSFQQKLCYCFRGRINFAETDRLERLDLSDVFQTCIADRRVI